MKKNIQKKDFTKFCKWLSTGRKAVRRNVSRVVMQALRKKYPNARIDHIDFVKVPRGTYYCFEMERSGAQDEYVYITPQGMISEVRAYPK